MLQKYMYIFIGFSSLIITQSVFGNATQNAMRPGTGNGVIDNKLVDGSGEKQLFSILKWARNSIETLLPMIAIGVFLFTGIRIALARGNPEEFKKAWMQFVYALVGMFIVGFAWVTVKLVSGLNI